MLSHVGLSVTPWAVVCQGSISMGILQARILEWVAISYYKIVTMTLYERQQKKHRCIEQYFGLFGRGRGDDLGEWH